MSLAAMTWALDRPIHDSTTLRVLMVLAEHADDTGLAYPKCSTIAARTMRSDDAVTRCLSALEQDGYISRHRLRRSGQLRGYLVRVLVPGALPVQLDDLPRIAADLEAVPDGWELRVAGQSAPVRDGQSAQTRSGQSAPMRSQEPTTGEPTTGEPSSPSPDGEDPAIPATQVAAAGWEQARELCEYLAAAIVESRPPGGNTRPPRITQQWVADMERLVRLEDHEPDHVRRAIDWAHRGPGSIGNGNGWAGWGAQVQSPAALRRHWDKMAAQANAKRNGGSGGGDTAMDVVQRALAAGRYQ